MYFLKKMLFLQFTLIAFSVFVTGQDIHEAAEKGDVATLKVLLERNPELINGKDFYGETSLHYACVRGHIDVVEFLIKKGANLHVKDNDEFSPLHFATGSGHKEVVSKKARLLIFKTVMVGPHYILPLVLAIKRL
jgi:ankyrin repeat protein